MVAKTIELPNIRKFFVPDPGHIIADADLAGADAQVVAWEADDEDLKATFRAKESIHIKNARDMFASRVKGWTDDAIEHNSIYKEVKGGVHATNYGATPRTCAVNFGWTVREAENFQSRWFGLHPGIHHWHERVEVSLQTTRSVSNKFGYRIVYFDRIESCLPNALAWIPQSTVAITCIMGALAVDDNLPWCQLLMQVHDSLVFQYPKSRSLHRDLIRQQLENVIPYDDPLVIPWSLKVSDRSWGDAHDTTWAA